MQIKKLAGWPPGTFQAAEARGLYSPSSVEALELHSASLVPCLGPKDTPEVFLLLMDPATEQLCSVRFKVQDATTAIRLAKALVPFRGKSLAEMGEAEIREDAETFPGLKGILKRTVEE